MSINFEPLRLLARDFEDLTIVSTHLQDALLPLTSMVYERKSATFTMFWPIDFAGNILPSIMKVNPCIIVFIQGFALKM